MINLHKYYRLSILHCYLVLEHLFFKMAKAGIDCTHISKFVLGFTEKENRAKS